MSLLMEKNIDFSQNLNLNVDFKKQYGEVHTNYNLIKEMFKLIPENVYKNPNLKWLDVGVGKGYFSIFLFWKLNTSLKNIILDENKRKKHILENMIFMIEKNAYYSEYLKNLFGKNANIIIDDYLNHQFNNNFDIIIGNPPFNNKGLIKVPTSSNLNKREDGKTIWKDIIRKSLSILSNKGLLLLFVPVLWMRPGKCDIYETVTKFKLHYIKSFNSSEIIKLFRGCAQTPCCYFLLEKYPTDNNVKLYDWDEKTFINFNMNFNSAIPLRCIEIINKIKIFVEKYGVLKINKSNLPSKTIKLSNTKSDIYKYPNIHSCLLENNKAVLKIKFSDKPCKYYNKVKIVMAHGMYGFPYIDQEGKYGISNRDKYIYISNNLKELLKIKQFYSTKIIQYLFESTRYRMRCLEKNIFDIIPNIVKIPIKLINNDSIMNLFRLNNKQKDYINNFNKKNYISF